MLNDTIFHLTITKSVFVGPNLCAIDNALS